MGIYYEVKIIETARDNLNDEPCEFNELTENFPTFGAVKDFFIEKYGKIPGGRRKIYVDDEHAENGYREIGFIHSYWNQDVSHVSSKWYQTDWIKVSEVEKKIIIFNKGARR